MNFFTRSRRDVPFEKRKVCATELQELVKWWNYKKIGFAPVSIPFSGISKIGFGFKLAFIGFLVQIGGFSLLLRPDIPSQGWEGMDMLTIHCENGRKSRREPPEDRSLPHATLSFPFLK